MLNSAFCIPHSPFLIASGNLLLISRRPLWTLALIAARLARSLLTVKTLAALSSRSASSRWTWREQLVHRQFAVSIFIELPQGS